MYIINVLFFVPFRPCVQLEVSPYIFTMYIITPWKQDVNWTSIRRSEDALGIQCLMYVQFTSCVQGVSEKIIIIIIIIISLKSWVRIFKNRYSETVVWRWSADKMFLEILQNSDEKTCVRVSFLIKLQASGLQLY